MTPLVSILVPCYNAERWVDAAIESALGQRGVTCEVIAVDDGSTDGTAARLDRFRDRGVLVLRQANSGASAARNRALEHARGDFVQYLDADDMLDADKIARQLERLSREPRGVIASAAWARFTAGIGDAVFTPEPVWKDLTPADFLVTCAMQELMFPPIAWLIPRAVCDAAGPWDTTLSMNDDGEYMSRVLAASAGIAFCADAQVYYRSGNPLSYGSRTSRTAADSELRAWDRIVATLRTLEDTPRVATAAATGYQRIAARYLIDFPDVAADAEGRERAFGGGAYRFEGGAAFRAAVRVLGWKTALRLRHAHGTLRSRRAAAHG